MTQIPPSATLGPIAMWNVTLHDLLSEEAVQLLGTIAAAILLLIAIKLREKMMDYIGVAWNKIRGKHLPMSLRDVEIDRSIHEQLIELRVKLAADRTRVFQFHNGQVFGNNNQLWRVSCTHETCKAGTSHELPNSQNLFASSIWEILEPLFMKQSKPGITFIDDQNQATHDLFIIDIKSMQEGYCKSFLISQGVYAMAVSPLQDQGNIYGFLAVCFDDWRDGLVTEAEITRHFAANISFTLRRSK